MKFRAYTVIRLELLVEADDADDAVRVIKAKDWTHLPESAGKPEIEVEDIMPVTQRNHRIQ